MKRNRVGIDWYGMEQAIDEWAGGPMSALTRFLACGLAGLLLALEIWLSI